MRPTPSSAGVAIDHPILANNPRMPMHSGAAGAPDFVDPDGALRLVEYRIGPGGSVCIAKPNLVRRASGIKLAVNDYFARKSLLGVCVCDYDDFLVIQDPRKSDDAGRK